MVRMKCCPCCVVLLHENVVLLAHDAAAEMGVSLIHDSDVFPLVCGTGVLYQYSSGSGLEPGPK